MLQHIGRKIVLTIGPAVALGLVAIAVVHDLGEEDAIIDQHERAVRAMLESASRGLQTVMLGGYADIAQTFADNLKDVPNVVDFRILRVDGSEAFRDNKTIEAVNRRRGRDDFPHRAQEERIEILPPERSELRQTVETRQIVKYHERGCASCEKPKIGSDEEAVTPDTRVLTMLAPIPNRPPCQKCHGGDHAVRGVIKISTSLAPILAEIHSARVQSLVVLVVVLVLVILLANFMIRRVVVKPIEKVTDAMRVAAQGDLTQQVPVFGDDELSIMAASFNKMLAQLLATYTGLQTERNKLATIILSAREGIAVTDSANRVVLVNPAAERLLGKSSDQIIREGLLKLFDDPHRMRQWLARRDGVEAELIEYNGRALSVHAATIRTDSGVLIGSAALIRDVTEEKRLQDRLWAMSVTDVLTGLYNRRFLDQTLTKEVDRSSRYRLPLSVLMFDVDHFKKFNDKFGHEMGDKVLQAVAATTRATVRAADIACRYGGEEFLVILPSTDLDHAALAGERLRLAIETMRVEGLAVTVSLGVASYGVGGATTPERIVDAADKALYRSKAEGRNRVTVMTRPAEPPLAANG